MSLLQRLLDHYSSGLSGLESGSDHASWNPEDLRQAAVLMPVTDDLGKPNLILTRRAKHLSTHAGQISFPGGMWEPEDGGLAETALRESHEEIGLRPKHVQLVSRFPAMPSRFGVQVTPFLGVIPRSVILTPCSDETDEIIPVPLAFFIDEKPERLDYRETNGVRYRLPSWHYENQEIWGLTAMIIDQVLKPLR